MSKKCPFCGSTNWGHIEPPVGDSFSISCSSKEEGFLDVGMPVELYGCKDCNGVWMASRAFAEKK